MVQNRQSKNSFVWLFLVSSFFSDFILCNFTDRVANLGQVVNLHLLQQADGDPSLTVVELGTKMTIMTMVTIVMILTMVTMVMLMTLTLIRDENYNDDVNE